MRPAGGPLRQVAVLTALAFGCATARPPDAAVAPPPPAPEPRVQLAEPQLELWMEGSREIDPAESARALEASRAALEAALSGRGLDGVDDPDELLVVRVRAVKRTDERRARQAWSAVALVVGVVVVVAVAIALASRGEKPRPPARAPGHAVAPAPPPGAGAAWRPPRLYPGPPPPVGVQLGFAVVVPPVPLPPPPGPAPTSEDLLAARGWFDGDEVELAVELTDARTGEVRWWRTVRDDVDPADADALVRLVDRALADRRFGSRARPNAVEPGPGNG